MSRLYQALMNSPLLAKALEMLKLRCHMATSLESKQQYLGESGIQPSYWFNR